MTMNNPTRDKWKIPQSTPALLTVLISPKVIVYTSVSLGDLSPLP